MRKQQRQVFVTESLYLAAALKASGCLFTGAPQRAPGRHQFEFDDEAARDLAGKFICGSLPVDAQALFNAFDDLRSVIRGRAAGKETRR